MKTKKTLSIFIFLFVCFNAFAQEHLKFKNIPIDGNINTFANELIKIGYTITETKGSIITLKGEFVNKQCDVIIVGTKKTNLVWKVVVFLPEETNWYTLKANYLDLKAKFISKYGTGESFEYFSKPYFEGDGYETQALLKEKATFLTFWKAETGDISVSISKLKSIQINYEDKINGDKKQLESNEIINNDI